ncbi:MAG: hypothetical protein Q8922_14950 [Bacteroidota bacterium]|nr:hypothetical protein [Bacteroidota bacterium]MDP4232809.1 hypothetical protein [Bacteroidota bacterium]MDP4242510.1 hypothetical protein [Bacteroidota bacterium]MDP4289215.1 hypothetical protein [Bacteroidota bacterium]
MNNDTTELLETVRKIHDLLALLAEDKIAQRDAKQRAALREIVGSSAAKQKTIFLMDGTRTQAQIHSETSFHKGNLSTMVGKMREAKLLLGDTKMPELAISIPPNFFESDAE